jgi:NitT/TauT family transport system substrate-binding protein
MAARWIQSVFLVVALFALAMLLLAVGSGCNERVAGETSSGPGASPTELRIGYFANATHAQALLGVSSGDFARAVAPARLSTRIFNAGPSLIEALFARQVDIGYVGPGPALNAYRASGGEGIRVISGSAANGVLIVAREDANIHTLAELSHKRIATPQQGNTQDLAARHYALDVLHQSDANNVIAVPNSEQAQMMSRGQIDAAWVPEPWGTRLIDEIGAVPIAQEKDLWPGKRFALTVVVTTPEFLKSHRDLVERFLAAHDQWTRRLERDPQRYASELDDALAGISGKRLKPGITSAALNNVLFTLDPLPQTFGTISNWTQDLGLASGTMDLSHLIEAR